MENTTRRMILVLLFTSIFCTCANAFALHKRSADMTSSENHLADALKVIQREKRRAMFEDMGGRQWRDDEDYYDDGWERPYPAPLPGYNPYDMQELGDLFSSDKYNNFGDDNAIYRPVGDGQQDGFLEADDMDVNTAMGDNIDDNTNEVSDEELQNIFTDAPEKPEKRTDSGKEKAMLNEALLGPAGKRSDKREYDPSRDKKSSESVKLSDLSPEQINALIQTVEEDAKKEAMESIPRDVDDTDGQESVSDEEINDIFGQGGGDDDNNEEIEEPIGEEDTLDEVMPESANKEWLMAQYLDSMQNSNGAPITKKKKRSQGSLMPPMADIEGMSSVYDGDSPSDLATELAIAREDIKVLRAFLAKEDAENAHLSHALSLATKSQTQRTDKYVAEEIDYIKQAIKDELDIQEVKDVLHIASSLDAENGGMSAPLEEDEQELESEEFELPPFEMPQEDKRGDPIMDEVDVPDQGDFFDDDVASDVTNGGMIDMDDQDLVKVLLASKLQKLLRQGSTDDLDSDSLGQNDLGGWYDQPVVPSAEDISNQEEWYLNPLMRELWQKYQDSGSTEKRGYPPQGDPEPEVNESPMDLNTLEQVLVQSLADQAAEGSQDICPAVEELSTECAFITELGLELDGEATELCNRHQMCYTCGSVLSFTPDDCDRGYLEEAARLCDNKNSCDKDASRLFILMLRYHDYQQTDVPPQCTDACAEEYIAGLPSK